MHLGLNIPSLPPVYKSQQGCRFYDLLSSFDDKVRHLAEAKVIRESNDHHHKFRLHRWYMSRIQEVSTTIKSIKTNVKTSDERQRLDHLRSCSAQVCVYCLPSMKGESIWSEVVSGLNDKAVALVVDAVLDVLPHRVNLKSWNKSNTRSCSLCGQDQTLNACLKQLQYPGDCCCHSICL